MGTQAGSGIQCARDTGTQNLGAELGFTVNFFKILRMCETSHKEMGRRKKYNHAISELTVTSEIKSKPFVSKTTKRAQRR